MLNLTGNKMEWIRKILAACVCFMLLIALTACSDDETNPYKDEYEPNNSITSPTDITLGTTYNASISKGDRDFYRFSVDNEGILENIKIEFGNFSETLQLESSIYDGLGNKIITYWNDPSYGYIVFYPTIEGTYYLEIGDKNNKEKGDYSLKVTDLNDSDANEPNNTFSTATVINTYPTGTISANIVTTASAEYSSGDWDYYLVVVNANKKVDFTVSPQPTDLAMHFKIYNESQTEIDPGLDGTPGQSLNFSWNNSGAELITVYVKLGGTLGSSYERDYTISFTETDADIK